MSERQSKVKGYTIEPKGISLYLINVLVCVSWMQGKFADLEWAKPLTLAGAAMRLRISAPAVATLLRWSLDLCSKVTDDAAFEE